MKKTKFLLITMLILLLVAQGTVVAMADSNPDPEQMAVYIKNDFKGSGAPSIVGDLYTAQGDVEIAWTMQSTGDFYHKVGTAYSFPMHHDGQYDGYDAKDKELSSTSYNESFPALANFPTITNYIATESNQAGALTISEDTHYGQLLINSNAGGSDVVFDVQTQDLYIVIDELDISVWKEMSVVGNHKLFLYVNNYKNLGQKFILNNESNNPDQLYVVSKDYLPLHASYPLIGHLLYSGIENIVTSGYVAVTGSVITDAIIVTMAGSDPFKGLFYAPYAHVDMEGSASITGRLVADSLEMKGNSKITFSEQYSALSLPEEILPPKYSVNAVVDPIGGGTISPQTVEIEEGQSVQFTVVPSIGYVFDGFTSSNQTMVPDGNNSITVTGDVTITAHFVPETVVPDGYKNGILGTYYDSYVPNEASKKVRRIDERIAFNWGYNLYPHNTMNRENFSVIWEGYFKAPATGTYVFKTLSDDGVILKVDGSTIIDNWGLYSYDYLVADEIVLEKGTIYPIKLEYQQGPLYAAAFLFYEVNGTDMGLVSESDLFVAENIHDEYINEQLYNLVEKQGEGFDNNFYSITTRNEDPTSRQPDHSEINNIDYNWGWGAPGDIVTDMFYGTMEGWLEAKFTEDLTLKFTVDDAIKVWIEDVLVIDKWTSNNREVFSHTFFVTSGGKYKVKVQYADFMLGASIHMSWKSGSIKEEIVPKEYMYNSN